jgi:murein DD-endopeptidase MepM/ murein hydrolase activator NlpD
MKPRLCLLLLIGTTVVVCAIPQIVSSERLLGHKSSTSKIETHGDLNKLASQPLIDQASALALLWPTHEPDDDRSAMSQGFAFYKFIQSKNPFHTGLDLVHARATTKVFPAAAGEIVKIQENDIACGKKTGCFDHGMGNTVIIRHLVGGSSLYTQYSHLDSIPAPLISSCGSMAVDGGKRGRHTCSSPVTVTVNTEIGRVGQSGQGNPTYWDIPHLHFELKENAYIGASSTSDDLGDWGYTAKHPSESGFMDPVPLFHSAIDLNPPQTAHIASNTVLKYGPGGSGNSAYRNFSLQLTVGQQYEAMRSALGTPLSNCSSGHWYEIRPTGAGVFKVGGNKQVGSGWVCSDAVSGVAPPATVITNATLDGQPWEGLIDFTIVGPNTVQFCQVGGCTVPTSVTNQIQGQYNFSYKGGGPANTAPPTVTPSLTQTLTQGSTITFTMNFVSQTPSPTPTPSPSPNPSPSPSPSPSSCFTPPTGILSWWSAENNSNDISGHNFDGTLFNGTTYAPGKVGEAFSFDGVDDHVRILNSSTLNSPGALTLEAWIFPTRFGQFNTVLAKWDSVDGVDQRSYAFDLGPDGRVSFKLNTDGSHENFTLATSNIAPSLNAWSHVAGVYDGSTIKVYVNGELHGEVAYSQGIFAGTADVSIGAIATGGPIGQSLSNFAGLIDEPTIYERALSGLEIQSIYIAGSSGKCKTAPTLTPTLLFDGTTDPSLANITFGEPVIDSAGRIIIEGTANVSCSFSACSRLFSISPTGTLNWAQTEIGSRAFADKTVLLGPADRVYFLAGGATVFAFDQFGTSVPGWPVTLPYVFGTSFSPVVVDRTDGTVYTRTGVTFSFSGFPVAILALNQNGSEKWRTDYSNENEGGRGIVQSIDGNIYTIIRGVGLVALGKESGSPVCTNLDANGYYGSFVGGSDGLFTSSNSVVSSYGGDCSFSPLFQLQQRDIELRTYSNGVIFGIDYPLFPTDLSQTRIVALSKQGTFLWRNSEILPNGNPIRAIHNQVLYTIGAHVRDGNQQKLFLLDASSGRILTALATAPYCGSCGVAVADDGTIYLNDLGSTKIYKLN